MGGKSNHCFVIKGYWPVDVKSSRMIVPHKLIQQNYQIESLICQSMKYRLKVMMPNKHNQAESLRYQSPVHNPKVKIYSNKKTVLYPDIPIPVPPPKIKMPGNNKQAESLK